MCRGPLRRGLPSPFDHARLRFFSDHQEPRLEQEIESFPPASSKQGSYFKALAREQRIRRLRRYPSRASRVGRNGEARSKEIPFELGPGAAPGPPGPVSLRPPRTAAARGLAAPASPVRVAQVPREPLLAKGIARTRLRGGAGPWAKPAAGVDRGPGFFPASSRAQPADPDPRDHAALPPSPRGSCLLPLYLEPPAEGPRWARSAARGEPVAVLSITSPWHPRIAAPRELGR